MPRVREELANKDLDKVTVSLVKCLRDAFEDEVTVLKRLADLAELPPAQKLRAEHEPTAFVAHDVSYYNDIVKEWATLRDMVRDAYDNGDLPSPTTLLPSTDDDDAADDDTDDEKAGEPASWFIFDMFRARESGPLAKGAAKLFTLLLKIDDMILHVTEELEVKTNIVGEGGGGGYRGDQAAAAGGVAAGRAELVIVCCLYKGSRGAARRILGSNDTRRQTIH